MLKVTILKLGDIIKFIIVFIIVIILIILFSKIFSSTKVIGIEKQKSEKEDNKILFGNLLGCLDRVIPVSSIIDEKNEEIDISNNVVSKNYLEEFLKTEISSLKDIEIQENKQENENENKNAIVIDNIEKVGNIENMEKEELQNNQKNEYIELAKLENIDCEVVTQNPIKETYNAQYGNVKIKNQTTYTLTDDILNPDITIDNKNILIFHTHSCESYTSSEKYKYVPTGNYRTTDLEYTVTRVGTELEKYLKEYNYNVIHNTDYHDYPAYNGSYTRSLSTVENILKKTPCDMIIDLHRDAIGAREDYAPTVRIGDDYAAQIMFVIGTNDGGLWHPNWKENLKFAIKIQEKAEEMYPGLFKPIMLTSSRYNQHTGKYASIIEVGATGNTLEQCLTSMKYLSSIINEIIK